jgi:DNA-directed RNA polymerase specialized sigma24 family protein
VREPTAEEIASIRHVVRRVAAVRGLSRGSADFDDADLEAEVLEQILRDMRGGTQIRNLEAYATRVATFRAYNLLRTSRRRVEREASAHRSATALNQHDEDIAQMLAAELSGQISAEQVSRAMAYGLALGDERAVRVVNVWLNLAEDLDDYPLRKDVAAEADVSLPTVDAALRRFGAYVRAVGGE